MKDDIKDLALMEVDNGLCVDARAAVGEIASGGRTEIPYRPGIYVAVAPDEKIHALHFFTEMGVRYVVGPLLRS